ncbi:VAN3-binding protein [Brassica rapa]|uniref:VAN3-binding protein n=1 Tax=Brassica campestris TaxID=3711 RepID=UPI00142DC9F6|nr:VAN3-binding protein [Brassica rapa]
MDQERTLNLFPYGLQEVAEVEEIEEDNDNESMTLSSVPENETSECSSSPETYPPIPPRPKTPREPMEFLCRSWSSSTSDISLALSSQKSNKQLNKTHTLSELAGVTSPAPAPLPPPLRTENPASVVHARRTSAIGKWFHHRDFVGGKVSSISKRDKSRYENAHLHTAVSIASLATAIAAVTASGNQDGALMESKMISALASASELLASHCVELAELSGAGHDRVVSAVRSAVDVRGPGDLLTLTAAAATALRGEAALRTRLPKEAKNNAAISPCERALPETHDCSSELDSASTTTEEQQTSAQGVDESDLTCNGELMQCTRNGVLRWKHMKVYINKKSQVVVEIKSKHVRGAFSMKSKGIVNDVCETVSGLQSVKETENAEEKELYFGISTGKGLTKFKCKSKADKQTWVDSIRNLLHRVTAVETINTSLETTNIGDST